MFTVSLLLLFQDQKFKRNLGWTTPSKIGLRNHFRKAKYDIPREKSDLKCDANNVLFTRVSYAKTKPHFTQYKLWNKVMQFSWFTEKGQFMPPRLVLSAFGFPYRILPTSVQRRKQPIKTRYLLQYTMASWSNACRSIFVRPGLNVAFYMRRIELPS